MTFQLYCLLVGLLVEPHAALRHSSKVNILYLEVLEAGGLSLDVSIHHHVLAVCVHVGLRLGLNLEEVLKALLTRIFSLVQL